MPDRTTCARRRRTIARVAFVCSVLLLAVVVISAYLRLVNAGLGCVDWPDCYGHPAEARFIANRGDLTPMRAAHRLVATAALVLVVALILLSWRDRALRRERRLSLTLLAVMLALSALGWLTGNSTLPAVVLANLLGGFLMLAVAWRLYAVAGDARDLVLRERHTLVAWARLGVALLVLEIVLGGLLSATFAARGCLGLPACGSQWWPAGEWAYAFDVFMDFAGRPMQEGEAGAVALNMLHRYLALAVALVLGVTAFRAIALRPALPILGLLFAEMVLGATSVNLGLPLAGVIAHNAVAALLLVAAIALVRGLGAPTAIRTPA